ncbi:MAG TPA: hypothetical protein VJ890_23980 [Vineibacter sp.]|nr:hypothetical protein [Vineibacter sp.]
MSGRTTPAPLWKQPDGKPVSCLEKLKVLNQNLDEIRQLCADAFEDAMLMGCDPDQIRAVFHELIEAIEPPDADRK